jgi:HIRAN domain-containing protein
MGLLDRLRRSSMQREPRGGAAAGGSVQAAYFEGDESLEVKGESFYQDSLWRVVAEIGREAPAILQPEPDNEFDPNAVSVWVAGLKVGHLGRDDAAIYQRAIQRLMKEAGQPVAVSARIFGGEAGKPTLAIWLYHDPSDFGLASRNRAPSGATRTGSRQAASPWRDSLSEDRLTAIKQLRKHLLDEADPAERHYLYNALEECLYASREVFQSALDEFEATCIAHHAEMDAIRPALVAEFGGLPMLPTYRQMAIMKQKAHCFAEALAWAEKGLALYGNACIRDEAVADLRKRVEKLRPKVA